MKKIIFVFSFILVCFVLFALKSMNYTVNDSNVYCLNANDMSAYSKLKKINDEMLKKHISTKLSSKNNFTSCDFNLYATSDLKSIPDVLDSRAINFLWLPFIEQNEIEELRKFDVLIVKNMPSFTHLKAINARVAFIPDAVNMKTSGKSIIKDYPMYYGDNDLGFSLSLYLVGPTDIKIDVFGNGFSGFWSESDIMNRVAEANDFQNYPVVLVDQSEEDIKNEMVNKRIIDVIENGGLPYVRYNTGIEKMFGEAVPMYKNEQEFLPILSSLLANRDEIYKRRDAIKSISPSWSSKSQADKFIELFDVMQRKRI